MDSPQSFGPPLILTAPLVTELPAAACQSEVEVLARLRGDGRKGLALLESATGPVLATTRRTLLVTRALARLELRAGRAAVSALCDGVGPLIAQLTPRLTVAGDSAGAARDDAATLRAPSLLDAVRAAAGALRDRTPAPLPPGLFGAFGYEIVDRFEALPPRAGDPLDEPDASFVLAGDVVVRDHESGRVHVITRGLPWEGADAVRARHAQTLALLREPARAAAAGVAPAPDIVCDVADDEFRAQVERFRSHIGAGDIFQGVLSRGLRARSSAPPLAVYRALRARNPSPYMFFLDLPDGALLGASPETFLRVERGEAEIRPIAGTAPRGLRADGTVDPDLDSRLGLALLLDHKEQAEHAMLLDLARNDIARVSVPGTTLVVQQLVIEKYSHVQHLVSRVRGRLQPDLDALHAYRAAANMGTLTGAPKVRAMELIRATEPHARGFYGGAAGCLLADGSFDSCIVIRSLRCKDGVYHARAGAGIVWDSSPQRELDETEHKLGAVRAALAEAGGRS
jgi:anthranilate synthase component 1